MTDFTISTKLARNLHLNVLTCCHEKSKVQKRKQKRQNEGGEKHKQP